MWSFWVNIKSDKNFLQKHWILFSIMTFYPIFYFHYCCNYNSQKWQFSKGQKNWTKVKECKFIQEISTRKAGRYLCIVCHIHMCHFYLLRTPVIQIIIILNCFFSWIWPSWNKDERSGDQLHLSTIESGQVWSLWGTLQGFSIITQWKEVL